MHYVNTTHQGTDCTVFGVSTQTTAIEWSNLLHREFDDHFYITDEPLRFDLADVAPHKHAQYRRCILFSVNEEKPQLLVIEGGKS